MCDVGGRTGGKQMVCFCISAGTEVVHVVTARMAARIHVHGVASEVSLSLKKTCNISNISLQHDKLLVPQLC